MAGSGDAVVFDNEDLAEIDEHDNDETAVAAPREPKVSVSLSLAAAGDGTAVVLQLSSGVGQDAAPIGAPVSQPQPPAELTSSSSDEEDDAEKTARGLAKVMGPPTTRVDLKQQCNLLHKYEFKLTAYSVTKEKQWATEAESPGYYILKCSGAQIPKDGGSPRVGIPIHEFRGDYGGREGRCLGRVPSDEETPYEVRA